MSSWAFKKVEFQLLEHVTSTKQRPLDPRFSPLDHSIAIDLWTEKLQNIFGESTKL